MSQTTIQLEGITIQQVGELIFEMGSTAALRHRNRETYLSALEDFSFAFLFGGQIAVSRRLPKVGEEEPGSTLLSELPARAVLDVSARQGTPSASEMLSRRIQRERLGACLSRVGLAVTRDRPYWYHYILREAASYLGEHPSLSHPDLPDHEYEFAKKSQGDAVVDYHMKDVDAEGWIDSKAVGLLARTISREGAAGEATEKALRAFVKRSILTHVQIFIWYRWATDIDGRISSILKIPCPTRRRLESCLRDYELSRRELMPHALMLALNGSMSRLEFLDRLVQLRAGQITGTVSECFGESLEAAAAGDTKRLGDARRRLRESVQRLAESRATTIYTEISKTFSIPPAATMTGGVSESKAEIPKDAWARLASGTRFETVTLQEYRENLYAVFPELGP